MLASASALSRRNAFRALFNKHWLQYHKSLHDEMRAMSNKQSSSCSAYIYGPDLRVGPIFIPASCHVLAD
jgi:hypothetical protein